MVMFDDGGTFVLSPSDLTTSADCEFGWLREVDVRRGLIAPLATEPDAMSAGLAELGDEHEQRQLESLRSDGLRVVEIERPDPYTPSTIAAAMDLTVGALRDGVDVVAQAVLTDGGFAGVADFLVRDDQGRFEVWDAKLARHAKVTALLQIAAYADLLDQQGVPRSPVGRLVLGNGEMHEQPLDDVVAVYRHRRRHLETLLTRHLDEGVAAAWNDESLTQCGSCDHCAAQVEAHRDLLLVAGLRRTQRQRLRAGGIGTIEQLAASTSTVPGLPERTWRTLSAQARMQVSAPDGEVRFEIVDAAPIQQLPAPDEGDVFFDFEGDPLWTGPDGTDAGLEYLFGWVENDGSETGAFTGLWADDRAEEREALREFLAFLEDRWERRPGMHVYHYAPYEVTALKRLTVRHTLGEDFLDDLLRAGVFVDLYATVRQSVRVSQPSYSIKKLEPLYMGDSLRGEVASATDSIVEYERYRILRERGADAEAQEVRAEIEDYNAYDCTSTMRLLEWLREVGEWTGQFVRSSGTDQSESTAESQTKLGEVAAVAADLLAALPAAGRSDEQQGLALLAAALGYHRRKENPFWWAHYARLQDAVDEWLDPRGTLVADAPVAVLEDWHSVKRSLGRVLLLRGELEPGSTIEEGANVNLLFEELPPDTVLGPGQVRTYRGTGTVLSITGDTNGQVEVRVLQKISRKLPTFPQVPMAITETPGSNDKPLEQAIRGVAESVAAGDPVRLPESAALDVLARRAPRLVDGLFTGGEITSSNIDLVLDAVRRLDRSYLGVQGPPGTGKTYLGSQVVPRLVEAGWRVGVVAQGHTTVETFLEKTIDAGLDPSLVAKENRNGDTSDKAWGVLKDKPDHAAFAAAQPAGFLIGGTAWAFASEKAFGEGELDLVVIDEAGQFCLANTIAVGRATQRLLLLGDPQQLPQVSQGTHPEPVDDSALSWLMEGAATLPASRGYFLARTRRMHPALTASVSRHSYDGRLAAVDDVTAARELVGVEPGVHSVAVHHRGNSVHSVEEADAVVATVRDLMTTEWQPSATEARRPMTPADVIVVAPYNAQVATIRKRLDAAGHDQTRVGTVDKFQGQEAAVVIVSMTVSSPADAPRGMDFLLNRNRLNVAVSRGQWAAYVVHSPALADHLPSTPHALEELGSFLRLTSGPLGGDA
ncbi:TM0106 family RecB-like putative nuclease [Aeromicrobium halocynthiae]|uniref:TM0106 family RecB-like putative nuclease n=1 Tax=Aeromicrobium halocynthiae TaxID=560557 RepID=A0ABN2W4L6_9ACTN